MIDQLTSPPEMMSAASKAGPRKREWVARLIKALSRRRWALAVGGVASVGAAVAVSGMLAKQSWESEGVVMYTPLAAEEKQSGFYVPPDLKTLVTLVNETSTLEELRDEFRLKVPVRLLEKSFQVSVPSGTKTIEVKLKWGEADAGARMVNRLIEIFQRRVVEIREKKIDGFIRDFGQHLERCKSRYQAALRDLQKFNQDAKTVDITKDLEHANTEVLLLQGDLARARRSESITQASHKELSAYIERLKSSDQDEEAKAREEAAAEESVSDNRRRQDRLRELVNDERARLENEASLASKRAEYHRVLKLRERGFASAEEVEKIGAEVGVLMSKFKETEKIRAWKEELEKIDRVVVPKGKAKAPGSPIIQQALFKQLELELNLSGSRQDRAQIEADLEEKRKRVDLLVSLRMRHDSLVKEVEALDTERKNADAVLTGLRKFRAIKAQDFLVVTAATPAPFPSSNRKVLLGGIAMAGVLGTFAAALTLDLLAHPTRPADKTLATLGLPVLARLVVSPAAGPEGPGAAHCDDPRLRLLALRLRQAITSPSGLVLFSALNLDAGAFWLVEALAQCLARRDERVLILDVAGLAEDREPLDHLLDRERLGSRDPAAGLADYLGFETNDLRDFIHATEIPGVDCLPMGTTTPRADALATRRMGELLDALRGRYTMILVIGPRADFPADLEMLAAQADGILFHALDGAGPPVGELSTVRHLLALGAPILGAVCGTPSAAPAESGKLDPERRHCSAPQQLPAPSLSALSPSRLS